MHESALTNAAVSLGLDGKRFTAPELQALMREKFSRSNGRRRDAGRSRHRCSSSPPKMPCDSAWPTRRLELILSLREVNHEGNPVRNFRVHAFYVPVLNGLEAEFVRDGALGIEGRIGTGERARMHGVFNKVLSEDRKLPIVRLNDRERRAARRPDDHATGARRRLDRSGDRPRHRRSEPPNARGCCA